jgi:predicted glycosyltransferase involved in capsule biosynthesis
MIKYNFCHVLRTLCIKINLPFATDTIKNKEFFYNFRKNNSNIILFINTINVILSMDKSANNSVNVIKSNKW